MADMIVLYGIKTCSTVKKAMKWLEGEGLAFRYHDVRKDGMAAPLLEAWCAALGWDKLLNRSSLTFRRLDEAEKVGLDEAKAVALMLAHPTLIRRPVTVRGEQVMVGFKPELYEAFFAGAVR